MRACACDTASRRRAGSARLRHDVRSVLCWPAFLLVPPLPSTDSATADAALFTGFAGTIGRSDFSPSCIIGFGSRLPNAAHRAMPEGERGDLPVPEQKMCAHARVSDDAGSTRCSRWRTWSYCLLLSRKHGHPEGVFRRSMAGLHVPLSTLHAQPRGRPRMTRGRCGSLLLHRNGLAPSISCQSPGAPKPTSTSASGSPASRRTSRMSVT